MEDLLYADMTYCTLCDRYFPGEEARAQHVQLSSNHPKCDICDRRFANKNSLRNVIPSARSSFPSLRTHTCDILALGLLS